MEPKQEEIMQLSKRAFGLEFTELTAGKATIYVAYALITPELARKLLRAGLDSDHANYRKLNKTRVAAYANAMRHGHWETNSATICLNGRGHLLDGQHRLEACVASGKPFVSLIIAGDLATAEVDRGLPRKLADHLRANGEKSVTELASVIRIVYLWEKKHPIWTSGFDRYPTMQEADALLDKYPEMRESISHARKAKDIVPVSRLAAIVYIGTRAANVGMRYAEEFCDGLAVGVEGCHDDPRHVAREMIQRSKASKGKGGYGPPRMMATLVKAWNAFLLGDTATPSTLRWRYVGPAAQDFPEFLNADMLEGI